MADVYLGRLTGKIRDSMGASSAETDPQCEVEVEILSGELTATNVPALVVSSTGAPMPWYAAAIHFFGTLEVVMTGPDTEGRRVYTIDNTHSRQPAGLVVRIFRSTTGETCLEIPTSATFSAVVLGLGGGGPGVLDPEDTFEADAGPGVVFPGFYARLMFIAPDGTTHGDLGERGRPLG
jgi:hypothetical protein